MRRRVYLLALTLIFLLSLSAPVFAVGKKDYSQVTTFGFNENRDRFAINGDNPPNLWKNWKANVGKSYSQPLILGGFGEEPVVIAAAGNKLHAWISPRLVTPREDFADFTQETLWSLDLKGDNATKSHPTLVELNKRKLIFIGSDHDSTVNGAWLQIFDITDIKNPKEIFSDYNKDITDVVSAPLVMDWNGHPVVVIACGNTSRVALFMNLDNLGKDNFDPGQVTLAFLSLAYTSGRTSSSPAPVLGGKGFAVGLDAGPNKGYLAIFMLNSILEDNNGKVGLKVIHEPYSLAELQSGLCASFSVGDGDTPADKGRYLFYGDSRSRVYCYDVLNITHLWVRDYAPGTFSNRSPALGKQNMYFPAMGGSSQNDIKDEYSGQYAPKLLAIDRKSGDLAWKVDWLWRLQTAPCIWGSEVYGPVLFIGDRDGYLNLFNAGDGTSADVSTNITRKRTNTDTYATGVSGEISSGHGLLAVTTEEGIKVWNGLPMDIEIYDLKSGIPAGEQAKIGQTYTATAKVIYKKSPTNNRNDQKWPIQANIGGYHIVGDTPYRGVLKDSNDKDLEYNRDDGQQNVFLVNQGDEKEFSFNWTASSSSKYLLVATNINYPKNPPHLLTNDHPELDYKNNEASVPLSVQGYDIKIKITPDDSTVNTVNGKPAMITFKIAVTRKDDLPGNIVATG
ncbi:MAG: PQQ-binding-like beta-propeller repeat protein, partial [Desulfocucumaceae bacterium]